MWRGGMGHPSCEPPSRDSAGHRHGAPEAATTDHIRRKCCIRSAALMAPKWIGDRRTRHGEVPSRDDSLIDYNSEAAPRHRRSNHINVQAVHAGRWIWGQTQQNARLQRGVIAGSARLQDWYGHGLMHVPKTGP
ncbi:hypothetical protein GW17_00017878 [Ensete ventricosum]|nr:hypothetical protein GW17_00017878 [Ensete ventricosum]